MSLTDAENQAIEMAAELFNLLSTQIVGSGPTRAGDLAEIAADIHRLQHRVMGQSAARLHPRQFRLLGEVVERLEADND